LVWRGKEKLWARDPYTSGAGCEGRREEAEEMLTGDEELRAAGNGATAEFPGGGACGSEERVRGLDWWGGAAAGPSGRLYRARRGRGGDDREQWP
jgi:hypothetical protein